MDSRVSDEVLSERDRSLTGLLAGVIVKRSEIYALFYNLHERLMCACHDSACM